MNLFDPPELHSERLTLSPIAAGDEAAVLRLYPDDPEVTRYVAWQPIADARRFVEIEARAWAGADECRGWLARAGANVVGAVIARRHGDNAEFSYVVERAHWNRGYATEMARAVLARARQDPALAEVWAVCDVENLASRRVLERAGMKLDRILPRHQRGRDCVRYFQRTPDRR